MVNELYEIQVGITGCHGQLEGRMLYREETAGSIGAILCPPHPLLAGNMENNVIQAVARKVAVLMPVLLFNYPAVGKSTSPQPELPLFEVWNRLDQKKEYHGIVEEVRQVVAWSNQYFDRYHLIGYSFGAWMALTALTSKALTYTAIAPPLAEEDFSALADLSLPVCLITAGEEALVSTQGPEANLPHIARTTVPGANHFFLSRENEVAQTVADFVMV